MSVESPQPHVLCTFLTCLIVDTFVSEVDTVVIFSRIINEVLIGYRLMAYF